MTLSVLGLGQGFASIELSHLCQHKHPQRFPTTPLRHEEINSRALPRDNAARLAHSKCVSITDVKRFSNKQLMALIMKGDSNLAKFQEMKTSS